MNQTTKKDAIKKANDFVNHFYEEWPEDSWFSIAPDWDINLYLGWEEECLASLYHVVNGVIDIEPTERIL